MKIESFEERMGDEWAELFNTFILSDKMQEIYTNIRARGKGYKIFPIAENTFRAFKTCSPDRMKAIIFGSDPYPGEYYDTKLPHATGLSLDCSNSADNFKIQPSLDYFFQGMAKEYNLEKKFFITNDLTYLEDQGVLLLNRALTINKQQIASHVGIWDEFWKFFFEQVMNNYINVPIIFLGKDAAVLKKYVFEMTHPIHVLTHPSYSARTGQNWETNKTFTKINNHLKLHNKSEIIWGYKQSLATEADIIDDDMPF